MSESDIKQLSTKFQELRERKGHFDNGESDPAVDKFDGEKHQVMKKLQDHLGKEGTPASEILQMLGKPDRMEKNIPELQREEMLKKGENLSSAANIVPGNMAPLALAPGPFVGTHDNNAQDSNEFYFLTYNWRGNHDYIYFKINAQTEKVVGSGWYNALE